MIKSGRKFKDDDVGERLDLAKRKLLVTLLNYHGVLQAYCRSSNTGAIRRGHVLTCSSEKKNHKSWNKIIIIKLKILSLSGPCHSLECSTDVTIKLRRRRGILGAL